MKGSDRLLELCRGGRMHWTGHGWIAEPEEVVEALARDGFQERKREVARTPPTTGRPAASGKDSTTKPAPSPQPSG